MSGALQPPQLVRHAVWLQGPPSCAQSHGSHESGSLPELHGRPHREYNSRRGADDVALFAVIESASPGEPVLAISSEGRFGGVLATCHLRYR